MTMKKFWIYILVTFGFGWLCQGFGILSLSIDPTGLAYTGLLAVCMFAPLFGTLAAQMLFRNLAIDIALIHKGNFILTTMLTLHNQILLIFHRFCRKPQQHFDFVFL